MLQRTFEKTLATALLCSNALAPDCSVVACGFFMNVLNCGDTSASGRVRTPRPLHPDGSRKTSPHNPDGSFRPLHRDGSRKTSPLQDKSTARQVHPKATPLRMTHPRPASESVVRIRPDRGRTQQFFCGRGPRGLEWAGHGHVCQVRRSQSRPAGPMKSISRAAT